MFGWFKSPAFHDDVLGEFTRARGHWRGQIALGGAAGVPLVLSGPKAAPDAPALAAARTLGGEFDSMRPSIECALFEHQAPYTEALAAGETPSSGSPMPRITSPGQVWPHVSLVYVSVTKLAGRFTTEFGYTTAWDEEHTLGARFQDGRLLELCGSVLAP